MSLPHGHHQNGGPHPLHWFYNREGALEIPQLAELYGRIAEGLLADGPVQFSEVAVPVPGTVHVVVCHERAPRGELVLKVEMIWADELTLDPLPHERRGPRPERHMYRSEGELTRADVAKLLRGLSGGLSTLGALALGDLTLTLPELVQGVVRYERPPRGELVLRIEVSWLDGQYERADPPIAELLG